MSMAFPFVESRGSRRGKYKQRFPEEINSVIVHTTGSGPHRRAAQWNCSPTEAAVRIYKDIMDAGPHYVVGLDGQITQVCELKYAAWHVGSKGYRRYNHKNWWEGKCDWWKFAFHGVYDTPLDMPCWKGNSVNNNSVGIEMVQPPHGMVPPPAQMNALHLLIEELIQVLRIDQVASHSEVHPLNRTRRGLPWDVPPSWYPGRIIATSLP